MNISKALLVVSIFMLTAIIHANPDLKGNWIGETFNPEKIFKLTSKQNKYSAYEVNFSTNKVEKKETFTLDLVNKISSSENGKANLKLITEDLIISENREVLYRDYKNKDKRMFCMSDLYTTVPDSMIERLEKLRLTANKHCLNCENNQCNMKIWKDGQERELLLCKRIFCQPTKKIKKKIVMEGDYSSGQNMAQLNYSISPTGKINKLKVLEVEGSMNKEEANEYLSELLKFQNYEPLLIDGKAYGIRNLRGVVAWNYNKRY